MPVNSLPLLPDACTSVGLWHALRRLKSGYERVIFLIIPVISLPAYKPSGYKSPGYEPLGYRPINFVTNIIPVVPHPVCKHTTVPYQQFFTEICTKSTKTMLIYHNIFCLPTKKPFRSCISPAIITEILHHAREN